MIYERFEYELQNLRDSSNNKLINAEDVKEI